MTPRRSTSPRRNSGRMTSLGEMISAAVDAVLLVFRCRREAKTPGDERRRQARQVERDAGDAADPRRSRDVRHLVDQPPYKLGEPSLFFELARRFGDEEPLTSQAGIRLLMARRCPPLIDEAWEEATSGAHESESRPRPPTEGEENHASSGGSCSSHLRRPSATKWLPARRVTQSNWIGSGRVVNLLISRSTTKETTASI